MTVAELRMELENYDDDTEVMIGQYQRYGSDFAYEFNVIEDCMKFEDFWCAEEENVIFLLEGKQVGIMTEKE